MTMFIVCKSQVEAALCGRIVCCPDILPNPNTDCYETTMLPKADIFQTMAERRSCVPVEDFRATMVGRWHNHWHCL